MCLILYKTDTVHSWKEKVPASRELSFRGKTIHIKVLSKQTEECLVSLGKSGRLHGGGNA
jgi:hypothetical protein